MALPAPEGALGIQQGRFRLHPEDGHTLTANGGIVNVSW